MRPFYKVKLVALILAISTAFTGVHTYLKVQQESKDYQLTLYGQSIALRGDFDYVLGMVNSLHALVIGNNGSPSNLTHIVSRCYRDTMDSLISYAFIAPGGVIEQVYPNENYAFMIDTNLMDIPEIVALSKKQNAGGRVSSVIYYPGGNKNENNPRVVGVSPVYMFDEDGQASFWGLVGVVADVPDLLISSHRLDELREEGCAYQVFLQLTEEDPPKEIANYRFDNYDYWVEREIQVSSGTLTIKVAPETGWVDMTLELLFYCAMILVTGVVVLLISRMSNRFKELTYKSSKDPLTGILNREHAKKEIDRILEHKDFKRGAFIIIDLDNFKTVNDTYGHQAGDKLLEQFSAELKKLFRKSDVLCRLGGDEFVVFIPFDGPADFISEKIKTLLERLNQNIDLSGKDFSVSVSIGISLAPEDGTVREILYSKADRALYHVKEHGKNCFAYYSEIPHR